MQSTTEITQRNFIEGEARGKAEGLRSAVTSLLFFRFEKIAPSLVTKLDQFNDTTQLSSLVVEVARAKTTEDARRLIDRVAPQNAISENTPFPTKRNGVYLSKA